MGKWPTLHLSFSPKSTTPPAQSRVVNSPPVKTPTPPLRLYAPRPPVLKPISPPIAASVEPENIFTVRLSELNHATAPQGAVTMFRQLFPSTGTKCGHRFAATAENCVRIAGTTLSFWWMADSLFGTAAAQVWTAGEFEAGRVFRDRRAPLWEAWRRAHSKPELNDHSAWKAAPQAARRSWHVLEGALHLDYRLAAVEAFCAACEVQHLHPRKDP
jgi:hypothetical protein